MPARVARKKADFCATLSLLLQSTYRGVILTISRMRSTWTVEPVAFEQLTTFTEGVYASFGPTGNELVNALNPAGHIAGAISRHRAEMRAQPDDSCVCKYCLLLSRQTCAVTAAAATPQPIRSR